MKTRSFLVVCLGALLIGLLIFLPISSMTSGTLVIPAFPGAEGFGSTTPGGRGGKVMFVTNVNDSGPGSLRAACEAEGPRIVLFRVSGLISLVAPIVVKNPYLTVAGQTAPGDGVCLRNFTFNIATHDVVVRYLRSRLGDLSGQEADSITLLSGAHDVVVDHCSATWSIDESLSLAGNVSNVTVQWCLIGNALNHSKHSKGDHGYGSLSRANGPATWHHNLWGHPFYPDAPAQSAQIPMIIGNTHDETRAFLGGDAGNFTLTWEQLAEKLIPNMRVDIQPEVVIAEYRRLYPHYSPSDVFFAATTAGRSWRGAIIEAEERAKSGWPAYAYQLNWATPKDGGKFGAPHASDIQMVFDNIDKPGATAIGPSAQPMADQMSETFIAFARSGNPNNRAIPRWETYTLSRRQTMVFNVPSRLEDDPRGAERLLFAKVPYVQPGT